MHTVIRYALWLRCRWAESDERQELVLRGFGAMPEVRDVLEQHLDSTADPSLAVRAVYGQRFPWLCLLDQRWAAERAGVVFAEETEQNSMWEAVARPRIEAGGVGEVTCTLGEVSPRVRG